MKEFDLSLEILEDIVANDVAFNEALKKRFQADQEIRPFRHEVAGLVGCELRHDILFQYLLKGIEATDEEKRVFSLVLANAYFYRHFSADVIKAAALEKIPEERLALLDELLAKADQPSSFVPENVKQGSLEYLSLRYNTPLWVLKIWEHFGYGVCYRLLRKNARPKSITLRVRPSAVNPEEIFGSADFQKTPVSNIATYVGKTPIRKLDALRQGKLFEEKLGIKAVIDQYPVGDPGEIFLYNDLSHDQAIKELIEANGEAIGLNIGVKSLEAHADALRFLKAKRVHNVNLFAAEPDALEASISRPQELVYVFAESSDFDAIRETPDFFVHLKQEKMDAYIQRQKELLEGASKYVALDGRLVYVVLTLNKKEGHNQIENFIKTHEGFELEKEEQLYPYDGLDTMLYYATLKKVPDLAKATPPLGEVSSTVSADSAMLAEGE